MIYRAPLHGITGNTLSPLNYDITLTNNGS
jgi:hypothetical protein